MKIPIDFVVCGLAVGRDQLPPEFQDNLEGPCADCGALLMWRPESPPAPHLCHECAYRRAISSDEPIVPLAGPAALAAIMGAPEGSC